MTVFTPTWDGNVRLPDGTTARAVQLAGGSRPGATLYELEPGAVLAPRAEEELLLVLSGAPTLRTGPWRERALSPGEVVGFAPRRQGIREVVNSTDDPVCVLICRTNDLRS